MAHNSGSARRRRRRIKALMAEHDFASRRMERGGDIIDVGTSGLRAVVTLLCVGNGSNMHMVNPGELATLLDLIHEELELGREVQQGNLDELVAQDAA